MRLEIMRRAWARRARRERGVARRSGRAMVRRWTDKNLKFSNILNI